MKALFFLDAFSVYSINIFTFHLLPPCFTPSPRGVQWPYPGLEPGVKHGAASPLLHMPPSSTNRTHSSKKVDQEAAWKGGELQNHNACIAVEVAFGEMSN